MVREGDWSQPPQTLPKGSGKEGVGGLTDNKRLKKAPRRLGARTPHRTTR